MSRLESAPILMSLGFVPDVDFTVSQTDRASVTIRWLSAATQPSEATLNAVVWNPTIAAAAVAAQNPERRDLRADATQAFTDNQTFLAITSPTTAQTLAQVKALTRQMNRVLKRLVQLE